MPDANGKLTLADLSVEIEDVIRSMPPRETLRQSEPVNYSWLGRAAAVVTAWSLPDSIAFDGALSRFHQPEAAIANEGYRQLITTLYKAKNDLRLRTTGPLSIAIGAGMTFDYSDDVRKMVEQARSDLFFIDPYLDAEFVSRYLPNVSPGTLIRLLTHKQLATLVPAAALMAAQTGLTISIRSDAGLHDRYLITDRTCCYQPGASFKDGGIKPTTLTQITDAFPAVLSTYEARWAGATIVR